MMKRYWRCIERDRCKGTAITNINVAAGIAHISCGRKKHSHEPDFYEIGVEEVVRGMKLRAAEQPNLPPSEIFRSGLREVVNEGVIANLPEKNTLIWTIHRIQNRHRPSTPQTLSDLIILPPYNRTLKNDLFLKYDSGPDDPERFLVFYTSTSLQRLCNSRNVFADGIFNLCCKGCSKFILSALYHTRELHGSHFPVYLLTGFQQKFLCPVAASSCRPGYTKPPNVFSSNHQ